MMLLATMFFGAGLIPTYLLVQSPGLTDTLSRADPAECA